MPVIVNVNPTSASEDLDFADNLAEGPHDWIDSQYW